MTLLWSALWAGVKYSVWARMIAAALIGLVALKGYGLMNERKGAAKAVAAIERKTDAKVEKVRAAQRAADRPGAADRLRRRYSEGD